MNRFAWLIRGLLLTILATTFDVTTAQAQQRMCPGMGMMLQQMEMQRTQQMQQMQFLMLQQQQAFMAQQRMYLTAHQQQFQQPHQNWQQSRLVPTQPTRPQQQWHPNIVPHTTQHAWNIPLNTLVHAHPPPVTVGRPGTHPISWTPQKPLTQTRQTTLVGLTTLTHLELEWRLRMQEPKRPKLQAPELLRPTTVAHRQVPLKLQQEINTRQELMIQRSRVTPVARITEQTQAQLQTYFKVNLTCMGCHWRCAAPQPPIAQGVRTLPGTNPLARQQGGRVPLLQPGAPQMPFLVGGPGQPMQPMQPLLAQPIRQPLPVDLMQPFALPLQPAMVLGPMLPPPLLQQGSPTDPMEVMWARLTGKSAPVSPGVSLLSTQGMVRPPSTQTGKDGELTDALLLVRPESGGTPARLDPQWPEPTPASRSRSGLVLVTPPASPLPETVLRLSVVPPVRTESEARKKGASGLDGQAPWG